jgi:hypothetical protein
VLRIRAAESSATGSAVEAVNLPFVALLVIGVVAFVGL